MTISVSQKQGRVPVTIIGLDGRLDGMNYQQLIDKGHELYKSGVRDLLLDLTDLTYISSAGMVAFHNLALLMRGEQPPSPDQGWSAYRKMGRSGFASGGAGTLQVVQSPARGGEHSGHGRIQHHLQNFQRPG
ncbi:MAG: hypothetical protein IPJ46_12505 [Anaerolineales bacterium]|nr:hypothetical protein [Anaerolineales bacterium]